MDFTDPDLDLEAIARGLGTRTEKIADPATIGDVLGRAVAHPGPSFLLIDREP
jgi:benzoylformate decarboxylase